MGDVRAGFLLGLLTPEPELSRSESQFPTYKMGRAIISSFRGLLSKSSNVNLRIKQQIGCLEFN